MITITNERYNGEQCPPITRQEPLPSAFRSLVFYELGYGGNIISISETQIVVKTPLLGFVDTSTFQGEAEELRPLINFCSVYTEVKRLLKGKVINQTANTLCNNANTLVITALAPIMVGKGFIQPSLVGYIAKNEEDIKKLAHLPIDALLPLAELKAEFPNITTDELLAL